MKTTSFMRNVFSVFICLLFVLAATPSTAQTSWKGAVSSSWAVAGNWTAGVPLATTDVVMGDAFFTGAFQPAVSASSTCKSLVVGGNTRTVNLSISSLLTVNGDITIDAGDTITHVANDLTVKGNWNNNGTYNATSTTAGVILAGAAQAINGNTTFKRLTVNTGSIATLSNPIAVTVAFSVTGIFDPGLPSYAVTLTGATFAVNAAATIRVKAAQFSSNYSINPTTLSSSSIVDYVSATINQTIAVLSYGTLTLSGGLVKTPANNITLQSVSSTAGKVIITAGTFDLGAFTINRGTTIAGGSFTVANNAFLKIGGTNTFPANYATRSLATASNVEYNGTNQTVSAQTYGNLILSNSSGAAVKTMPATAMTVANNFTGTASAGATVSYTALAAITVRGNVLIDTAALFNGGAASHIFIGSITTNGTYTGSTSTVTMSGIGTIIGGSGSNNFYNLTITGPAIVVSALNISIAGNLVTSGAGTFTQNTGGTLTMTGTTKTISGTGATFYNLAIPGIVSTTGSFIIAGNLAVNGSLNATAGTINMNGTGKTFGGSGSIIFYAFRIPGTISTAINFSMRSAFSGIGQLTATAGTLTFIGTSTFAGFHNLFNVTLNGSKLQLGTQATMGVAGAFTRTAGTFDVTTTVPNTVDFNSAGDQSITATTYNNLSLSTGGTKTAAGAITANNALTINVGTVFVASSYAHTVNGNWINNGSFTAGTSTMQFRGALNTTLTGATGFYVLTVNKSAATNFVTLNNNVSTPTLTMTQGELRTGSNTITVTTARSGNGIVLGTITQTHAFSTGVAYPFEGPNNTITFATITSGSVTSITVTTTPVAAIDFPLNSSINRVYTISVTNTGTYTATLKLHYQDTELSGNAESTMGMWRYVGSWTGMGKSSNDVTNNWVQQTSLTDITSRWSISDNSATSIWKGATSTAWGTASNWKTGTLPLTGDIVQIGIEAFTNQPVITTSVTVKSITFGSVQPATLALGTGGALTVKGNITGNWTADAVHTINVGTRTLSVGGDLILNGGSTVRAILVSASTGTITVSGSLTQTAGTSIAFTGAGILNIGGDFNFSGGTFTPGTSTVNYNGAGSQIVAAGTRYANVTFNKPSGTATISSVTNIDGNLTLSTGGELNLASAVTVNGNVTINAGATLSENGIVLTVGGNWAGNGIFSPSMGTVVFNSSGAQTVALATFDNLTVNKSAGVLTPGGALIINGDLSLLSGILDLTSYTADRSVTGGTLTLGSNATLKVGGAANFPANYNIKTFSPASTVEYNGTMAQSVAPLTYGNLVLNNGWISPKTLTGPITVLGDLFINSGATLDGDSNTLILQGDFNNAGTFTPTTSTVVLQGGDSVNHKSINGPASFYNFIIDGYYGTTQGSDLAILGDYEITGYFDSGANGLTLYGDQTVSGTVIADGFTIIMGTQPQTLRFTGTFSSPLMMNTVAFRGTEAPSIEATGDFVGINLEMSNTSPTGIVDNVNMTVLGYFLISPNCIWNDGGMNTTFLGPFTNEGTVLSEGALLFDAGPPLYNVPATTIYLGSNNSFQSTGSVEFAGGEDLTIDGNPYSFNDVIISNVNEVGITPAGNWVVNGNLSVTRSAIFHAGTGMSHLFDGDIRVAGTFEGGNSTITATSIDSSAISGSGDITFYNLIIEGQVDAATDFNISGNFTDNGDFEPFDMTIAFTGDSSSVISGSATAVPFQSLLMNKTSNAVTLHSPITVGAQATFISGVLHTDSVNYPNFLPGSSVTRASNVSYVDGPVRKTGNAGFIFPVGAAGIYRPISISAPSIPTDHFTAQYFNRAQAYGNYDSSLIAVSTCEYWILNRTNGTSAVNVGLGWNSADCFTSITDVSTLAVARWNGSAWTSHGNGGTTGGTDAGTVVTSAPVTSFSPFALGSTSANNTLPIELLSFTAKTVSNKVDVIWQTVLEINNAYFTVERSADGINFSAIGKVDGAGNSTSLQEYALVDNVPLHGISYYRLRQTDFDGQYTVSNIVAVTFGEVNDAVHTSIGMYPTPAHDQLFIQVANMSSAVDIKVFDMAGKEIYSHTATGENETISISTGQYFTPGVYVVTASSAAVQFKEKLLVQ